MMNRKEGKTFSRPVALAGLLVLAVASILLIGGAGSLLASDLGLQEADCRCCHSSGVPDRHHLLTRTAAMQCLDCHQMVWDDVSLSFKPVVARDCLYCHTASLADRHHLSAKAAGTECLGCHQMTWDPVTQSYYLTFPTTCQPVPVVEECTDGLDNDGDGQIDCNDSYCAGTSYCLPPQDEICTDGIDNDADDLIDCADPGCSIDAACQPTPVEVCTDGLDNDGDTLTDCADSDCAAAAACQPAPAEVCTDGIDNDGDALADCADSDCAAAALCQPIPIEVCIDSLDNDGDALADCADPDCIGKPECPPPPPAQDHYSHMAGTPGDCAGCHQKNLSDVHQKQCAFCHGVTVRADVQAAVAAGNTSCLACHFATVHLMRCDLCHSSTPTSYSRASLHYGHTDNTSCGICHAVPATATLEPTGQYCKLCHGSARSYSSSSIPDLHYSHLRGRYYYPYSCQMCHGEAIPQTRPDQCNLCHTGRAYYESQLPAVHTNHRRLDCTSCHYDPRLLMLGDPSNGCQRCHSSRPYSDPHTLHLKHSGMQCWSCHTFSEATATAGITCAGCHGTQTPWSYSARYVHYQHSSNNDSGEEHQDFDGTPCSACHSRVAPLLPPLDTSKVITSGNIMGKVTGSNGIGLNRVTVSTASGYSTATIADGSFRIDGISPGNFTFVAAKSGFANQSQPAEISAGGITQINFTLNLLPNTGHISGKVTDSAGRPITDTSLSTDVGGYYARTASDGSYAMGPVVAGTYRLTAREEDYYSRTTSVQVPSIQPTTVNFILVEEEGGEVCNDTYDNDHDGEIDCLDADCTLECNICPDLDGDSFSSRGGACGLTDCNDNDFNIRPGAVEFCDGLDNDCNGGVDEGFGAGMFYRDADNDGYGASARTLQACTQPVGYSTTSGDCNDTLSNVNPGVLEIKDGVDNDCDGALDCSDPDISSSSPCQTGVNLALGRPATASKYESGYEAAKAVDGSPISRWWARDDEDEWLRIDLGSIFRIYKVTIAWHSYYAEEYEIYTSKDASNWSRVYSTSSGSGGQKEHTFTDRDARYVRIYCKRARSGDGFSINEVGVYRR